MKKGIFRGCHYFLSAFERESGTSVLKVYFGKVEASSDFHGLFMNTGVRGMPEGSSYQCVDMLFPFVETFIDRATVILQYSPMTFVHEKYSELRSNQ